DDADIALVMDKGLVPLLQKAEIKAAIVMEGIEVPSSIRAAIVVGRSRLAMAKLNHLFEEHVEVAKGVHKTAILEEGVVLGKDVAIGAMSYIAAGAEIGDGTIIHPQVYVGPQVVIGPEGLIYSGVRIGARVKIGARCILHFNTSIGADGFSFVTPEVGSVETAKATGKVGEAYNVSLVRIASLGAVELGDDVEVGANSSIDRGTIISTSVGNGTKIDNQVQIGHNVRVGENCMLCGRVGIAGSATLGDRVVLGGATGVADHVTVGDDTVCMAMSGIARSLPPRSLVGGTPARPRKKMIENMFNLSRIKALIKKIEALSSRVEALEDQKLED
ncbi:MAG TPA: UDP-3-O-(3-hydroxymyristoyl)glucosamine N-acyltransferase, partial [Rhodospirillaceae bacterium]|nr:UDP-3-O-(3-hydroxymyristoyl)glucosamine N-acyltransferase [Rhodospirillaceae bacterium]